MTTSRGFARENRRPHAALRAGGGRWRWALAALAALAIAGAFHFSSERNARGGALIETEPSNAMVVLDGTMKHSPARFQSLPVGAQTARVMLTGYDPVELPLDVTARNEARPEKVKLVRSLGVKFMPVGDVLMSVWLVRVLDYDGFCAATGRARLVADFPQDNTHPVVRVNAEDAVAFCEWLTKRELETGQIEEGQFYSLPTDAEWSSALGLADEGGNTPEERDGKSKEFPWGKQWPPPSGAGNFADSAGRRGNTIAAYHDGFAQTSPVESFAANALGLFDMSGNVWQWCADFYKAGSRWGVLRGGSWGTAAAAELRSSYRFPVDRSQRDVIYGFRCVLVTEAGR